MRILIVLTRDEYIRNYLQTNAFGPLHEIHECMLLLTDQSKQIDDAAGYPGFIGTVRIDQQAEKGHYDLFNMLTWRNRSRSRTFRYRFSRYYRTYPWASLRYLPRNLLGLLRAARYVTLGNRIVGRFSIPWMIRNIPINAGLARIIDDVRPDLVIVPCSTYDPVGNDVVRLGRHSGHRTLYLIDNWDNLSSKSIYWALPDYLGVWGQQSRDHAAEIHGIDPSTVYLLGTPRFENYYQVRELDVTGPYPFPYVLFCGSALAFDEIGALHRLDDEIDGHPEVYDGIKIVYRPHPYRQPRLCPDVFHESDFRHVVLDRQIADAYHRRDVTFHPPLDYYPTLLAGARLVVCPLTTMLIESLVCGTPVLAITYDDGIHYTSPHNAYRYYMHFEGIDRIPGLQLVPDAARLGSLLRSLISDLPVLISTDVDTALEYFLHRDDLSYADRLANAVTRIAEGELGDAERDIANPRPSATHAASDD